MNRRILMMAVLAALATAAALFSGAALTSVMATPATAGPLTITRWTVDVGGAGFTRAGTWTLSGTVGQADAGLLSAGTYTLRGGFWGGGPLLVTGVETPDPSDPVTNPTPSVARVLAIAPNPTGSDARFGFELPEARRVDIQIYSVSGALVRTVTSRVWPAGRHEIVWNARDAGGSTVAVGLYFARVRLGGLERTQKLLIVR